MTNPDTNTLNGALEQLGITMADNLVTMGVSDADPSDGLTTLAGKILEIAPVPPTPTPSSISLTGTKSILSFADSEQSVLTATVLDSNDDPVEGVTVTFYNGSTSMGTADTNSSGIASKTYSSAGVGDVSFTAEVGSLVSETYSLQDCLYYDSQTVDKSRYSIISGSATLSYSNNGFKVLGNANNVALIKNNALTLPNQYSLEITITELSNSVSAVYYGGFCIDDCLIDFETSKTTIYRLSNTSTLTTISAVQANDVLKIEMDNGTMKIYVNDDLKTTQSITHTGNFQYRTYNYRSCTTKDLKVKPL